MALLQKEGESQMKKLFMRIMIMTIMTMIALVIAMPGLASAQGQYVDNSIGVDISWPNGSAKIPNVSFGIVGVTDGLVYSNNNYLAKEAKNFSNLSLYVNTGLNASSTSIYYQKAQVGCNGNVYCAAYNYGYNAGIAAVKYAQSQGVNAATTWWLDVETANSWTTDYAQNIQSLQGEIDALKANGATTVGVYSTTAQWNYITGGWQNGFPSWGATTWTTAKQALTYSTGHEFTGGPSYLMQYRPKGSQVDYDVACPAVTGAKGR